MPAAAPPAKGGAPAAAAEPVAAPSKPASKAPPPAVEGVAPPDAEPQAGPAPDTAAPDAKKKARLHIDAGVAVSFDSNVAQGEYYQTIAGKSTRGAAANQADRLGSVRIFRSLREDPVLGPTVYQRAITADYQTAQAQSAQAGLPLDVNLGVRYRPVSVGSADLWLGYQFAQTFMLFAQSADTNLLPSAETYHLQRHQLHVLADAHPREWLDLTARVEGFVTLSGLQGFTPFQGGVAAQVNGVITESARWRTLAQLSYLFRKSFDGKNDGYLDGHRIQIGAAQQLRLGWVQPQLGYRFTYDATGTLQVSQPLAIMYTPSNMPSAQPIAADLGTYTYSAPLSYQGHQVSAEARFSLPMQIQALAALRYEYQRYADTYGATYVGLGVGAVQPLPPFAVPAVVREDHRLMLDLAATKELPHHITIGLGYSLLANFSNIANVLDNRTYTKHAVIASVGYTY